jgi:hypothetical protein
VTASTAPGETEAAEKPLMGYPSGWSVRAGDRIEFMVSATVPSYGSVFSVGSIAWSASLSYNGYDSNVAKITGNVLGEFARRGSEARP